MRMIGYFEERLFFLAPLTALMLTLDGVAIAILTNFNDPTWWSDGRPEDFDSYTIILKAGAISFALYIWLALAKFLVGLGPIVRVLYSLLIMIGILFTTTFMIPYYITAFHNIVFVFILFYLSLFVGLFIQILQLHTLLWGRNRHSAPEPVAEARVAITLIYVFFSGLLFYGWLAFFL